MATRKLSKRHRALSVVVALIATLLSVSGIARADGSISGSFAIADLTCHFTSWPTAGETTTCWGNVTGAAFGTDNAGHEFEFAAANATITTTPVFYRDECNVFDVPILGRMDGSLVIFGSASHTVPPFSDDARLVIPFALTRDGGVIHVTLGKLSGNGTTWLYFDDGSNHFANDNVGGAAAGFATVVNPAPPPDCRSPAPADMRLTALSFKIA